MTLAFRAKVTVIQAHEITVLFTIYIHVWTKHRHSYLAILHILLLATTQILHRLAQYEKPKPAPAVQAITAPVGDIPENLLVDHQAMLEFIDGDLQEMLNYAK